MTTFDTINVERIGAVAVVSFDRPHRLNAINVPMLMEFRRAADTINSDESIHVVVLTGRGDVFCAGADVKEPWGDGSDSEAELLDSYKPAFLAILDAPKPWVSAVSGTAAGAGAAFAMACDLTVMAHDSCLYQAFAAIGLGADCGATWHLARTVGRKRAYELLNDDKKLAADQCLSLGLCNRVAPADQLMQETLAWADHLSARAPLALRQTKSALRCAMESTFEDTFDKEARLQAVCIDSDDGREGVQAFLEKR